MYVWKVSNRGRKTAHRRRCGRGIEVQGVEKLILFLCLFISQLLFFCLRGDYNHTQSSLIPSTHPALPIYLFFLYIYSDFEGPEKLLCSFGVVVLVVGYGPPR